MFLFAENCPRSCNVKAMHQYSCMGYELTGVVSCLIELVVRNNVIPVRKDERGLLCEWSDEDLPLETVAQCKLSDQFGTSFSAGSEKSAQQFYVTAIRVVVRQIRRAMSGQKEQYMSMTLYCTQCLICHVNHDRLVDSINSLGRSASMKGMLSAREIGSSVPKVIGGTESSLAKGNARTRCPRFVSLLDGLG